jgi:hypothetical protein
MNLPSDAIKTVEKGAEMLLRVISAQRQELTAAMIKLDELHNAITERLPLDKVMNDKINADTRRDDRPSISGPAPTAGEIYRGVNVDRVLNP